MSVGHLAHVNARLKNGRLPGQTAVFLFYTGHIANHDP